MTDRIYRDKAGEPITQEAWAELYDRPGYRRIARKEIDGAVISTIWHGGYTSADDEKPMIFETLVDSDLTEGTWVHESSTLKDAKAIHRAAVAWVTGKGPRPGITDYDLKAAEQRFHELTAEAEQARERRNRLVRDAVASGWSHARIAEATGLTRARVGQIALTRASVST